MAKKTEKTNVKCFDCYHAVLQQWDNNPVVAYCNKTRMREVANTIRTCDRYKNNPEKPEVIKLTRFR